MKNFKRYGRSSALLAAGLAVASLATIAATTGTSAQAASFDCKLKDHLTPNQATICLTPKLNLMDSELELLYKHTIKDKPPVFVNAQKIAQEVWLKEREACGIDKACLEKAYQSRINALKKFN
ncbi:lysozyme inhibitor LprI family protein [Martelella sp. AD-3]|uniref:lysozyme inhibitor LprI family protein n=1 Tax=Martelella sp. AD-3 TaxID=686597 RepID=UPI0004665787|nr:lysozyme inhibitor LprI family protein [Martelella sp. AD-3]AMM85141.1 hypothetical protein AZF01_12850 [Martelella sp. AD-3]